MQIWTGGEHLRASRDALRLSTRRLYCAAFARQFFHFGAAVTVQNSFAETTRCRRHPIGGLRPPILALLSRSWVAWRSAGQQSDRREFCCTRRSGAARVAPFDRGARHSIGRSLHATAASATRICTSCSDAHLAGATYREIAEILFGESRVLRGSSWKTHDLHGRTIRLVRAGSSHTRRISRSVAPQPSATPLALGCKGCRIRGTPFSSSPCTELLLHCGLRLAAASRQHVGKPPEDYHA